MKTSVRGELSISVHESQSLVRTHAYGWPLSPSGAGLSLYGQGDLLSGLPVFNWTRAYGAWWVGSPESTFTPDASHLHRPLEVTTQKPSSAAFPLCVLQRAGTLVQKVLLNVKSASFIAP